METLDSLKERGVVSEDKRGKLSLHLGKFLTPQEWVSCCVVDGENYVGGCCGNMSYAQDLLNDMFRRPDVSVETFCEWGKLMRGHDGFEPSGSEATNPLDKLLSIYDLVKDLGESKVPLAKAPYDPNSVVDAVHMVASGCRALSWDLLVRTPEDQRHMRNADRIEFLVKFLPPLRTLADGVRNLAETLEGFAIVEDREVLALRQGPAIFGTQAEADKVLGQLNKQEPGRVFCVVPCSCSFDEGIVLRP